MNFDELQMIWDSQKNEPLFTIDRDAMIRIVEKQSNAIHRDLKTLELTAILVLIGLGIATLIDTFFNGEEYFQLWSVAFEFLAAGFLLWRRRVRESRIATEPLNLVQRIETAINQSQTTIQRGRDMAIVFSVFIVYGLIVRMVIYGWQGSEIKAFAALLGIIILTLCMKTVEIKTHRPRMKNLDTLRRKLLDVS